VSISSSPLCLTRNLNRFCSSLLPFVAVGSFVTESLTKNLDRFWWTFLLRSLHPRPSVDLLLVKQTSNFEWPVRHSSASIIGSALIPLGIAMQDLQEEMSNNGDDTHPHPHLSSPPASPSLCLSPGLHLHFLRLRPFFWFLFPSLCIALALTLVQCAFFSSLSSY
jgi:hypothetical protein